MLQIKFNFMFSEINLYVWDSSTITQQGTIIDGDENGKETFQSKMKNMASQNHVAKCKYNLI